MTAQRMVNKGARTLEADPYSGLFVNRLGDHARYVREYDLLSLIVMELLYYLCETQSPYTR